MDELADMIDIDAPFTQPRIFNVSWDTMKSFKNSIYCEFERLFNDNRLILFRVRWKRATMPLFQDQHKPYEL